LVAGEGELTFPPIYVLALVFGRDAMNRFQHHKEGGIADVYDRQSYSAEIRHAMEAVTAKLMAFA
jgi:hypothetical protein